MTMHMAKGLEFEAVFLPRLEERELPYWRATTADQLAEERRLFYVGITRAKRVLELSWTREGKRSTFLQTAMPIAPATSGRNARPARGDCSLGQSASPRVGGKGEEANAGGSGLKKGSWLPPWMRERDRRSDESSTG
jgi:DNA helicase-2/ATP-dependent DNA helicase PcrA